MKNYLKFGLEWKVVYVWVVFERTGYEWLVQQQDWKRKISVGWRKMMMMGEAYCLVRNRGREIRGYCSLGMFVFVSCSFVKLKIRSTLMLIVVSFLPSYSYTYI